MPYVEASTVIKGTPQAVYALAKDMESYPQFMEDLVSLKVLEREGNQTVTAWAGRLQGKVLKWTERDTFYDDVPRINYRQLSGDLKKFEGDWRFESAGEGCKVTLTVDFELGIPMFAAMFNPLAKIVVKKNCESMLQGLKRRIEGGV